MRPLHGVWPALLTPFTPDGRVNESVLRDLVEYLLEKRVDGFYVCGTTGEGIFMPVDDRRRVAEIVLDQVKDRVPVIVHVGSIAVGDAVTLARHAQEVGAAAVSSIIPPLYRDAASVYAYFSKVAEAVPDLPFLGYIFGGPTDAVPLMRELMRIPNLAGTKYTGPNMHEFRQIVTLRDRDWTVFSGMDEQCLFAAMMGSTGNIGSTLNFMPGVYREIRKCCEAGDLKQGLALQIKANEVTSVLHAFGFPGALREVMRMLGFECGEPRLPNLPLSESKRDELRSRLEDTDFWELVAMGDSSPG
ncbi:MAG: dihydrodipicolinate synthase family protein [Anaerolineae bacterium]|nr:dihydrodipicolinate synthase family protein [Anaerolineae bacterium]